MLVLFLHILKQSCHTAVTLVTKIKYQVRKEILKKLPVT